MTNLFPKSWPEWARSLSKVFLAGFVFGVVGYGVGHMLGVAFPPDADLLDRLTPRWADVLAVGVAFFLLGGSVFVLVLSMDARRLGRLYKLEGPASTEETAQARLQCGVMAFSGVLLLLPIIFSFAGLSPVLGVVAIGILMILHTAMNVRVYRQADELLRRTMMEAGTIAFFLGQGVLFVWAAAERMGAVPPITAWDIYAVLMCLYLVASITVSVRRGLA